MLALTQIPVLGSCFLFLSVLLFEKNYVGVATDTSSCFLVCTAIAASAFQSRFNVHFELCQSESKLDLFAVLLEPKARS